MPRTQCEQDSPELSSPKACSQGGQEFWNREQMLGRTYFHPVLKRAGQLSGTKCSASVPPVPWGFREKDKPLSETAGYPSSS